MAVFVFKVLIFDVNSTIYSVTMRKMRMNRLTSLSGMSYFLIVLPELNPVDMTYRQVKTYLKQPSPGASTGDLLQTENSFGMGTYPVIAALSVGIILFSVISVYFHTRKRNEVKSLK